MVVRAIPAICFRRIVADADHGLAEEPVQHVTEAGAARGHGKFACNGVRQLQLDETQTCVCVTFSLTAFRAPQLLLAIEAAWSSVGPGVS